MSVLACRLDKSNLQSQHVCIVPDVLHTYLCDPYCPHNVAAGAQLAPDVVEELCIL